MKHFQTTALAPSTLFVLAAGCKNKPATIHAAIGVPVESFGALPCKFVSADPAAAVTSEPIKKHLVGGNPDNIDTSSVRLTASAAATAKVDCAGDEYPVEFAAIENIKIESPNSTKVGDDAKYRLRAYSKAGKELDIGNMPWDAVTWKTTGPLGPPTPDTHPIFPGGGPHTDVKLTGAGKVTVTATYAGMTATRSDEIK